MIRFIRAPQDWYDSWFAATIPWRTPLFLGNRKRLLSEGPKTNTCLGRSRPRKKEIWTISHRPKTSFLLLVLPALFYYYLSGVRSVLSTHIVYLSPCHPFFPFTLYFFHSLSFRFPKFNFRGPFCPGGTIHAVFSAGYTIENSSIWLQ